MALLEALTINLGAAVLKTTAKVWLNDWPFAEAAAGGVVDTFKKRIEDFETRRAAEKLFKGLEDEVARRLKPLVTAEFPHLPENEQIAATLAVADVLHEVTVPETLVHVDLDASRLEALARPIADRHFASLATEAREIAALLLTESCNYAVMLAAKLPNFQVAATRELLKRHTELQAELANVLDSLSAMRRVSNAGETNEARDFELQYRRALVRRLDRLELFGVRMVSGGAREYPLTVAYVSLTVTRDSDALPHRVEEALSGAQRIVIRGEAGSGKTTLLMWLAVRAASRDFSRQLGGLKDRVPFFLALRNYRVESLPRPEQFLDHSVPNLVGESPKGWVASMLRRGAMVLLDGLDELPASRRIEFSNWLRILLNDYEDLIVVLSSRPAALDAVKPIQLTPNLAALSFATSVLQPMTLADSESLVVQWHNAVGRNVGDEGEKRRLDDYERDLRLMLRERPAIRTLASNPLLCSMICALNWDRRKRVPDQRMELYRAALDMLLEARDVERGIKPSHVEGLDQTTKEELLDSVAYWMLRNGDKEADRASVVEQIDLVRGRLGRLTESSDDVLQELLERSGVLIEPQHGVVSWLHRTFQEYMGARQAIVANDLRLLADQAKLESWRETIVFAAGHAKGQVRDKLVRELLKRKWLQQRTVEAEVTAACCLETVGSNLDPVLLAELQGLARKLFPPKNPATAQLLAPAAAMDPLLLHGHQGADQLAIAGCIRAAGIVGGATMLGVIQGYAGVAGENIDVEIARAWTAFDVTDFFDRVIKPREGFLGLSEAPADAEQVQCLYLLIDSGALEPPFTETEAVMRDFRARRSINLKKGTERRREAEPPATATGARGWWSLSGKTHPPQQYVERLSISASILRRVVTLTTLEELIVGYLDSDTERLLGRLKSLRRLSFAVERPANLDWLTDLTQLVALAVADAGVTDLTSLQTLSSLRDLSIANTALPSLAHIPRLGNLQRLRLAYPGFDSLDGLERFVALRELDICGPSYSFDAIARLAHLQALSIAFPTKPDTTVAIPYRSLKALTKLRLQGLPRAFLAGLQAAPALTELAWIDDSPDGPLFLSAPPTLAALSVETTGPFDFESLRNAWALSSLRVTAKPPLLNLDALIACPRLDSIFLSRELRPEVVKLPVGSTLRNLIHWLEPTA